MWTILAILAAISLILFWRGPNAVWGGIALGAVCGLVVALVALFRGASFMWVPIGKGVIIGVLLGVVLELVGRLSGRMKATTR